MSPIKASLAGIALLLIASYFIFTKQLPFTHHYTIKAVVVNSNLLAKSSPVRIGGVDVGKVTSTGRFRNTDLALVTMEIDSGSQPIHTDATITIRPRLFLEGNFYVQLSPGTGSAPLLPDGGTIPLDHSSPPVQIDQVLDVLTANNRYELQRLVQGLGQALDTEATPAEQQRLDPAVRGLTGAQAINSTFDTSAPSLRDSAIVSQALVGAGGAQLSRVISGFGRASEGLARADGQLSALISDFDSTLQATAAQQQGLRQTVRLLGPTATDARTAFAALDRAFPPTEQFADQLATGLPQLPATISAAYPWLRQAAPLLSESELRGLLRVLAPATGELAKLVHDEVGFLPQIDAFDRCITRVFIPTGNLAVNDGPFSAGVPNYQEFWYAMTGQAAEGQQADGNGNFLRIGATGGPFTVESSQTNFYGADDTGFAQMAAPPLRTRPAYPNKVPPLNRAAACYAQPIPNVNGPASTGAADGSSPNGPRPPIPNDPSENTP